MSEAGYWLPKQDAARFLKVDVRTIDRRKLPKRRGIGRPVEVWVAGATSDDVSSASETDQDTPPTPEERALALSDSVSDIIGQHTAPLYARIEDLARENGELSERLKASETQADADRQRLRQELESLEETARILAAEAADRDALAARFAASEADLDAERRKSWWDKLRGR